METSPAKNKMITSAPTEKAGFHFAGDGIYENIYIWATNIEKATEEYLKTRKLINPVFKPIVQTENADIQNNQINI